MQEAGDGVSLKVNLLLVIDGVVVSKYNGGLTFWHSLDHYHFEFYYCTSVTKDA